MVVECWVAAWRLDLEPEWNLLQIQIRGAPTDTYGGIIGDLSMDSAPNLEKNIANELQMKPGAPTSNGMQPVSILTIMSSSYYPFQLLFPTNHFNSFSVSSLF